MSAYGSGAPTYENAELQKNNILGRLRVARGMVVAFRAEDDPVRAARWQRVVDDLLDRLLEVRGL